MLVICLRLVFSSVIYFWAVFIVRNYLIRSCHLPHLIRFSGIASHKVSHLVNQVTVSHSHSFVSFFFLHVRVCQFLWPFQAVRKKTNKVRRLLVTSLRLQITRSRLWTNLLRAFTSIRLSFRLNQRSGISGAFLGRTLGVEFHFHHFLNGLLHYNPALSVSSRVC